MKRQQGQHIVVTGASAGIGRAVALRMAAEGARVSLLARRVEELGRVAEQALEAGAPETRAIGCDVGDPESIERAFTEAVEGLGPIRAAVAVAGIGGPNHAGEGDRFEQLVRVNLGGTYHTFRAAEKRLVEGGPRHLVAFSSILGRFGVPGYTGYCASKTGILGLVRALATELAAKDVQVNALVPGWVETEMAWEGIEGMAQGMGITREEAYRTAMSAVPMGRMSQPEDVAGVVAWLLSPDARGVTGQGIDINNGAWMG